MIGSSLLFVKFSQAHPPQVLQSALQHEATSTKSVSAKLGRGWSASLSFRPDYLMAWLAAGLQMYAAQNYIPRS